MNVNMLPQSRQATNISAQPLIRNVNVTINNPTGVINRIVNCDISYDRNILQCSSDNFCAVDSFSLPLQGLPLFIFPIQANQANPALSTLAVGVCENLSQVQIAAGTSAAVTSTLTSLLWIPQHMGLVAPTQSNATQVISPYYYCFSYEHFVNLVNTAVTTAWTAQSTPGGAGKCPVFSYNSTTHTFGWSLDTAFTDDVSSATGYSVCWNEAFDNLVNNFNTIDNSASYSGGFYILENVNSRLSNVSSTTITLTQDYPTTDSFNSAQRIVILTSSIPTVPEFFAAPYAQNTTGLSNEERILVDVNLDFDNNVGAQRSVLVYQPSIKQWADMESSLPLRRITMRIMWADSLNNFYDIPLTASDTVTVKLGFRSKLLSIE